MTPHPYVVLGERAVGFDTLEEAKTFASDHAPCVICERQRKPDGSSILIEILRNDWLYDEARGEWRIMMG